MQNLKLQYYLIDSISRVMPGKADFVTVRDKDGNKVKLQKRHLVMTIGECYQSSVRITRSVLLVFQSVSLRPKNSLLTSDMPHNVCGYKYHNISSFSFRTFIRNSLHCYIPPSSRRWFFQSAEFIG